MVTLMPLTQMTDKTHLTAEQEIRLQVKYDTEYEFLHEHGYITDGDVEEVSQDDVRELVAQLPDDDRERLDEQLAEKQRRLGEIMDGKPKTFPGPFVQHSDLVKGVRIPGFYRRKRDD